METKTYWLSGRPVNFQTKTAWELYGNCFENFADENPINYMELSKEYFTKKHGFNKCENIQWQIIQFKLESDYAKYESNESFNVETRG